MIGRRAVWARYREIAQVLVRHGLGVALDALGLARYLPWRARRRLNERSGAVADGGWAERVRLALADLGPTYVKLGQLASTRADLLPPELVCALERLQDDVPPVGFDAVQRVLHEAWGMPAEAVLAELDPRPLAQASIAQVHRGRLKSGAAVVIKVRRPGIVREAEADFHILRSLADIAAHRVEWLKAYRLDEVVDSFIQALRDEMDLTVEARNTETARRLFHQTTAIAEVHWPWTRPAVLVMQDVEGIKITDRARLDALGIDRRQLARRLVQTVYQQIFEEGFFHADPHPGNVHVAGDGQLIFLDWGLVGILTAAMRRRSVHLVFSLVTQNSDGVADALRAMAGDPGIDRQALVRDVERLRRRYYEAAFRDFSLGQALMDIFQTARRHQLTIPTEYFWIAKAAVTVDGVVRQLDPEFSLAYFGQSLIGRLAWARVDPQWWAQSAGHSVSQSVAALGELVPDLDRALAQVARGSIHLVLEHKNLDRVLRHWEKLANRLALSFLIAAVVLATAWVAHRGDVAHVLGLPLGSYAFLAVVAAAIGVIVMAVRRGVL